MANELKSKLENSTSYSEWRQSAKSLQKVCNPNQFEIEAAQSPNSIPSAAGTSIDKDVKQVQEKWLVSLDVDTRNRFVRLQEKINFYKSLIDAKDIDKLKFHLRGELLRKHYGLGGGDDVSLHSDQCAKNLFDSYMDTVCQALGLVAQSAEEGVADINGDVDTAAAIEARMEALQSTLTFFNETRHSFGRSALLLSGGARMGLVHTGVIKALIEQRLLPRVISGASAGSIVTAMIGVYKDDELVEKFFNPSNLNLRFFARGDSVMNLADMEKESRIEKEVMERKQTNTKNDRRNAVSKALRFGIGSNYTTSALIRIVGLVLPPPLGDWFMSAAKKIPGLIPTEYLLDVHVLAKAIRDATGDVTFKEAFERTGRIINITVSPQGDRDFPLLLNYLTAPNVLVWSAAVASSAIPGVFAPVELMAKDIDGNIVPNFPEGCRWTDGSVESDLPMQRLAELFNVNHTVVSQVNIHARFIAPLLGRDAYRSFVPSIFPDTRKYPLIHLLSSTAHFVDRSMLILIDFLRDQIRGTIRHLADAGLKVEWLKFIGRGFVPLLTQQYHGDITIFPNWTIEQAFKLLQNPTNEEYIQCMNEGERVTWPHISKIRSRCMIEFMLDDCVFALHERMVQLSKQLRKIKSLKRGDSNQQLVTRNRGSSSFASETSNQDNHAHAGNTPIPSHMKKSNQQAPAVFQFMAPSSSVVDMSSLYIGGEASPPSAPMQKRDIPKISKQSSSLTSDGDDNNDDDAVNLNNIQSKLKLRIRSVADFSTFQHPIEDDEDEQAR